MSNQSINQSESSFVTCKVCTRSEIVNVCAHNSLKLLKDLIHAAFNEHILRSQDSFPVCRKHAILYLLLEYLFFLFICSFTGSRKAL